MMLSRVLSRWALLALVAMLLSGCASVTPLQQNKLSELQAAANRVTKYYRVPTKDFRVGWPVNGTWDGGLIGTIVLTPDVLNSPSETDFVLAVGLAGFVNNNIPFRGDQGGQCDAPTEPIPQRMVHILMIGRALSERDAFLVVQEGLRTHPSGPQCIAINYLIILFPQ